MVTGNVADLPRPKDNPPLPDPAPIQTFPYAWKVITPKTLPSGDSWVFFAVSPKDYENMARTQADTLRWVCEAAWRLRYYRDALNGGTEPECK